VGSLLAVNTIWGADVEATVGPPGGAEITVPFFAASFKSVFSSLLAVITPETAALLGLRAPPPGTLGTFTTRDPEEGKIKPRNTTVEFSPEPGRSLAPTAVKSRVAEPGAPGPSVPLGPHYKDPEIGKTRPDPASYARFDPFLAAAATTVAVTAFPTFTPANPPPPGAAYPLYDHRGRLVGHMSSRICPGMVSDWPTTRSAINSIVGTLSNNLDQPLRRSRNPTINLDVVKGAAERCWRPDLVYRPSAADVIAAREFVADGLARGFLEKVPLAPGASCFTKPEGDFWACVPIFTVSTAKTDADGVVSMSNRGVGDLRHPNSLIVQNAPPIASMADHIGAIRASSCISVSDAKSGFYSVPVNTDPNKGMVIAIPHEGELFKFTSLTMGGSTSPGWYSAFMERFGAVLKSNLRGSDSASFTAYIDDTALCHAPLAVNDVGLYDPAPQLSSALALAATMLGPGGFLHAPSKTLLLMDQVETCGRTSGSGSSHLMDRSVREVLEMDVPVTFPQLRTAAGFFSSIASEVIGLQAAAGLLSQVSNLGNGRLTKLPQDTLESTVKAFHAAKALVAAASEHNVRTFSISHDPRWSLCVYTDASRDGVAAIAVQRRLPSGTTTPLSRNDVPSEWLSKPLAFDGDTRLVGIASRSTKKKEKHRSASGLETLGLDLAGTEFQHLFTGRSYFLFSDNKALVCRLSTGKTHPKTGRILDKLCAGTNCMPIHIDGLCGNLIADQLSRSFTVHPYTYGDIFTPSAEELDIEYTALDVHSLPPEALRAGFSVPPVQRFVAATARRRPGTVVHPVRATRGRRRAPSQSISPLSSTGATLAHFASDSSDKEPQVPGVRRRFKGKIATLPLYASTDGSVIPAISDPSSPWTSNQPYRDPGNDVDRTRLMAWAHHESAHLGTDAVLDLLRKSGHSWDGIRANVTTFCATCGPCQRWSPVRVLRGPSPADLWSEQRLGMHLACDVFMMAPDPAGYSMIFVVVDVASGFRWATPLRTQSAIELAEAMESFFGFNGPAATVTTDNHPSFHSVHFQRLLANWGATHRPTSDHSKANLAETACKVVGDSLRKTADATGDPTSWRSFLQGTVNQINAGFSRRLGYTPFELYHARVCPLPFPALAIDPDDEEALRQAVVARMRALQLSHDALGPARAQAYAATAEARIAAQLPGTFLHLTAGTRVLVVRGSRAPKHLPRADGPFRVVRRTTGGAYWLAEENGTLLSRRFPPSRLQLWRGPADGRTNHYLVDRILNDRLLPDGATEYLVKWVGYAEPTWEHQDRFYDSAAISDYFHTKDSIPSVLPPTLTSSTPTPVAPKRAPQGRGRQRGGKV
jgi:hypothetical protein